MEIITIGILGLVHANLRQEPVFPHITVVLQTIRSILLPASVSHQLAAVNLQGAVEQITTGILQLVLVRLIPPPVVYRLLPAAALTNTGIRVPVHVDLIRQVLLVLPRLPAAALTITGIQEAVPASTVPPSRRLSLLLIQLQAAFLRPRGVVLISTGTSIRVHVNHLNLKTTRP